MPDTDPTAPDAAPFGLEFGNPNPQLARTYQAGENLRAGLNTAGDVVIDAATAGPMALGRLASGQGSWADVGDAMMSFVPELKGAAAVAPLAGIASRAARAAEGEAAPLAERIAQSAISKYPDSESIHMVDVGALDKLWAKDKNFYVSPTAEAEGGAGSSAKLDRAKQFLSELGDNEPWHAPILGVGKNTLGFEDGRHRFAAMRDLGMTTAPVAMDEQSAAWAKARGLLAEQQAEAPLTPQGIRAYHGSPHDFEKFDLSKIGTGEGAQAYGHGLYFAENPGVAGSYKTAFSSHTIDGKSVDQFLADTPKIDTIYDAIRELKSSGVPATIEDAAKFYDASPIPAERRVAEAVQTYGGPEIARRQINKADVPILDKMVADGRIVSNPGHMYEVAINADPEHFLDWDKPLSEQRMPPELVNKVADMLDRDPRGITGADVIHALSRYGDQVSATEQLRNAGIPGIRYLDEGSRGANVQILSPNETTHGQWLVKQIPNGQVFYRGSDEAAARTAYEKAPKPTRNYVVFDDKTISILKKYGMAGLIAGGAAHFSLPASDTEGSQMQRGGRVPRLADGGTPSANPFDAFDAAPSANPFDAFDAAPTSPTPAPAPAEPQGIVAGALHPITSYPSTYAEMNREAVAQMGRGVGQLSSPSGAMDVAKGLGNVALGGASYVTSPINAALRTVVGEPIEKNFGVPKQYSEFAAGLALPGIGFTRALPAAEAAVSPTAAALRAAADAAYKAPEVAALKLHPQTMALFGQETAASLERGGYDPLLAPKTFGLLDKTGNVPEGTPFVTAQNFDTLRRQLGKAAESTDRTERKAATLAKNKLDDFMANIPQNAVLEGDPQAASETLQVARGNYAALMRAQQFDSALDAAERQAARAGVGGNWENATRQQISRILNSPAKIRGYSPDERQALEDYVAGNFTRNSLRVATKVMGGDNPLMAAIHAGLAWPTWGLSLAAPLTGYALKRINNALSQRDLDALGEMLRSRSPLGDEMRANLSGWARTGGAMFQSPTTQNATRFAAASQLLASKMRDAGFSPDPHQLMNPFGTDFKGTLPAGAQEQGQEPNKRFGGEVGYQREGYKSGGATQHLGEQRKHGGKVLSRRERVKTVLARHGVGM